MILALAGFAGLLWGAAAAQNPGLSLVSHLTLGLCSIGVAGLFALPVLVARSFTGRTLRAGIDAFPTAAATLAISAPWAVHASLQLADDLPGVVLEWPKNFVYCAIAAASAGVAYLVLKVTGRVFDRGVGVRVMVPGLCLVAVAGGLTGLHSRTWRTATAWMPEARSDEERLVGIQGDGPVDVRGRVLLLGADGLDWAIIGRLVAEGKLPNLARLARNGFAGEIQPLASLSPILWTSIATGRAPDVHGIMNFAGYEVPLVDRPLVFGQGPGESALSMALGRVYHLLGAEERPFSLKYREVPTLWDLAGAAGLRVAVVNWLLANPAEKVPGFFVSPYAIDAAISDAVGDVSLGTAWPVTTTAVVRAALQEVASSGANQDEQRLLVPLKVVETLLADDPALDLVMAFVSLTDSRGHLWERAIRRGESREILSQRWADWQDAYELLDRALEDLLTILDEEWTLLVVADHGWNTERAYPGHLFPVPAGALFICCRGSGAHERALLPDSAVSTLDIAPTVLALLGLPVARSLPGTVPFPELRKGLQWVDDYDGFDPMDRYLEARLVSDQDEGSKETLDKEQIERLKALGYL